MSARDWVIFGCDPDDPRCRNFLITKENIMPHKIASKQKCRVHGIKIKKGFCPLCYKERKSVSN